MDKGLISTKLRSVITLVDKLRDISLESYIKLPKIVAVGSQSSGKSSLVEQIVGIDFLPRGSGVVTRRPLEIRMIYEKDLKEMYAQFAEIPEKMTDFNKVREGIEKVTDKICGNQKNIVDKPIVLDIYSANCPNLTIIDLPGLTRIPIDGQDKNIHEITTKMIEKYMSEPSTIILCVIPANQDITNDEVLHMARKIDKTGERTIGCITKIDIMDRGTDARDLLMNKGEVPLKLGYIGIKNRSQADINEKKTVQDSIENEKMFFSKSPIYSSLPLEHLGTTSLVTKMTQVLTDNICKFLPELISKIKERKSKLHDIVKSYGRPLPKTMYEKQSLLWEMSSQFLNEYKKCLVGQISILKCQENLLKTASHIQHELYQCLNEELNVKPKEMLEDKHIEFAIRKFEGSNMPGFPSISAFLYLLHPLLQKLKLPIEQTINNVYDELMHIVELIMSEVAHEYVELKQHITDKVQNILAKFRRNTREFIESLMEAELNYIYTNDPNYETFLNTESVIVDTKKEPKNPMVAVLRKRIDAYYKVVTKNLRDLAPKNIKFSLLIEATKTIEFEIFQIVNQEEKINEYLKIGESSKNERIKNEQEYDILCKAEQFLLTHSGFSSYKGGNTKDRIIMRQQEIEEAKRKKEEKDKLKLDNKKVIDDKEKNKELDKKKTEEKYEEKKEEKEEKKEGFFDFFTKKQKEERKEVPQTAPNTTNNSPLNKNPVNQTEKPQNPLEQPQKKPPSIQDIFGVNAKKQPLPPPIPGPANNVTKPTLTDTYNKEMGKATDKTVDAMYANEQFKEKSKQAVTDGASLAAQKQLGVSKETGNMLGKGAGWLFGQEATQNYLKEETKKNLRSQTQISPK